MLARIRFSVGLIIVVFLVSFSSTAMASTYEVKDGDTLWRIAYNNEITVEELKSANALNSNIIHPGQALEIPGSSGSQIENPTEEQPSSEETSSTGKYLDWSEVRNILSARSTATITDVATGLTFSVKRRGGTNHADFEPRTAADTAIMKEIYGSWSWKTRAIIVSINGRDIAASMNGMPHGGQYINDNNFPGHFCIHFKNSWTHNSNSIHSGHQASVKKAAGLK